MNLRRALLGVALVAGLFTASPTRAADNHTPELTRAFRLHVPATQEVPFGGRPLVVYLHGCIQTAAQAEASSHFNALADKENFVVVYPQQNVTPNTSYPLADGNGTGCWNWFHPDHQKRGQGEPKAIVDIVEHVMSQHAIDRSRVYVAGLSAGADMATILAAAYPDVFAAAASVAGCAYATCADVTGRLAYDAMGEHARVVPVMTVQGTADTLNNYAMGATAVQGWLGANDWADDAEPNASVDRNPDRIWHEGLEDVPAAQPGTGDPCVRNSNWPCPGGVLGLKRYPVTRFEYDDSAGCPVVSDWTVHLMEHAQPNASASESPFTDPLGPDLTGPMWQFFKGHTAAGQCTGEGWGERNV